MRCERARAHKGTLRLLPCLIVHKCTTPTRCEYVRCTLRAVFATSRTHPRYVTKSQSLAEPAGGASSALGARALKGRLAESPIQRPFQSSSKWPVPEACAGLAPPGTASRYAGAEASVGAGGAKPPPSSPPNPPGSAPTLLPLGLPPPSPGQGRVGKQRGCKGGCPHLSQNGSK